MYENLLQDIYISKSEFRFSSEYCILFRIRGDLAKLFL